MGMEVPDILQAGHVQRNGEMGKMRHSVNASGR